MTSTVHKSDKLKPRQSLVQVNKSSQAELIPHDSEMTCTH